MLALTDNRLAIVMTAARSLSPEKRSVFLQRVAAQLARVRRPGDADVERAAQMALRGPDNFNDVLDRQVRQLLMNPAVLYPQPYSRLGPLGIGDMGIRWQVAERRRSRQMLPRYHQQTVAATFGKRVQPPAE
jgi:hypothetical protein